MTEILEELNKHKSILKDVRRDISSHDESLKDIKEIVKTSGDNSILAERIRNEVMEIVSYQYCKKDDLGQSITRLRQAMTEEIEDDRKRTNREIYMIMIAISSVVSIFAWVYVNIISK